MHHFMHHYVSRFFLFTLMVCMLSLWPSHAKGVDPQPENPFPRVKFITNQGDMIVELNRFRAPITVKNFMEYVADGSYNNTIFHRVIADFVVQGGGFTADWTEVGTAEPIVNESGNGLANSLGTIAMARNMPPHTATRQFYFNVQDNISLDPSSRRWGYAVFGQVVDNIELLETLATVETHIDDTTGFEDVPVKPLVLLRIDILPE